MHNSEYLTFEKFPDPEQATTLTELLSQNGIKYQLEDSKKYFDPTFSFNALQREVLVKIKQEDFGRANSLYNDFIDAGLDSIDKDYYLYQYSAEELRDVLENKDSWGRVDLRLARKLLEEKGLLDTVKESYGFVAADAFEPKQLPGFFIAMVWLGVFLFPFVTIFIGWMVANTKRTLANGEMVYLYKEADRKVAQTIFLLSLIILCLLALYLKTSYDWIDFGL